MGYTTYFQGQFHCYRPENEELGVFLKAIREGELSAVGPLGDWLMDRGDPRGEVIARLIQQPDLDLAPFWQLFGLRPEHAAYLKQFSETRRMRRNPEVAGRLPDPLREAAGLPLGLEGGYFVGGGGFMGQEEDESVLDDGEPPEGQPGLWCHWTPTEDGTAIAWDGGEKFYFYAEWLEYLLRHFLGRWSYVVNGVVTWQGEADEDRGTIRVVDNVMEVEPA